MRNELHRFRQQMEAQQIDAVYIPTSDFHESEYVHEHFKVRQWLSGFTGSAGTLVVTKDEACLWTDGRYFTQAHNQLQGSEILLMKQGVVGVPTITKYLQEHMQPGQTLAYDGRVVNAHFGKQLRLALQDKQLHYQTNLDLAHDIWEQRPSLPTSQAFLLETQLTGQSREEKIAKLRNEMRVNKATHHVIASLDDIAWLLNIRGRDILHTPVVLSYVLLSEESCIFFVDEHKLNEEIKQQLSQDGITIQDYNTIYESLPNLPNRGSVLLDPASINDAIIHCLPEHIQVMEATNPTQLWKAIKNNVELEHLRQSHIKDGVAITKFIYWLKTQLGKQTITERVTSQKLLELRMNQENFIEPSFSTIAAYQEHGAMMHYSATEESDAELQKEGLFLIDSGGQYMGGTTDITRTIVLGNLTNEQKKHYTLVVKGMLSLSNAIFLEGTKGINLDILARGPIWSQMIDYRSGTGHGVGYMLGVHEGPHSIRWKPAPGKGEGSILYPGMVVTNEPGIYIEGSHGIRIENELIVQPLDNNEYGQFLHFETMTFAPIDLEGIDSSLLTNQDIQYLNDYHALVWTTLAKHLTPEEQAWLRDQTKPLEIR